MHSVRYGSVSIVLHAWRFCNTNVFSIQGEECVLLLETLTEERVYDKQIHPRTDESTYLS